MATGTKAGCINKLLHNLIISTDSSNIDTPDQSTLKRRQSVPPTGRPQPTPSEEAAAKTMESAPHTTTARFERLELFRDMNSRRARLDSHGVEDTIVAESRGVDGPTERNLEGLEQGSPQTARTVGRCTPPADRESETSRFGRKATRNKQLQGLWCSAKRRRATSQRLHVRETHVRKYDVLTTFGFE